jgi:hypothetical protein
MFVSNKLNDTTNDAANDTTSDSYEEPIQFRPHQPRLMPPPCHVTASISRNDSLVIHTPTIQDNNLKALIDSDATKLLFRLLREREITLHSSSFKPSSHSTRRCHFKYG